MKKRIICFLVVFSLLISLCINGVGIKAADIQDVSFTALYMQSDAREMFNMINEFRATHGNYDETRAPLVYDYELEKVAMQRAAEIAIKFEPETHLRPDGGDYLTTLSEFGFDTSPRGYMYGENILFGTEDTMKIDDAFAKLCEKEGTMKIMTGFYTAVGVGHIKMEDKTDFWVQVFADTQMDDTYVDPYDGNKIVTVKVDPSLVESIKVDYTSGTSTVAVGETVDVPSYTPKVKFTGSELDKELELTPLVFESVDSYVQASGGKMTGLSAGTGTITAELFGTKYSYNITVTGSGKVDPVSPTPAPTASPVVTPTPEVTPEITPIPTSTITPTETEKENNKDNSVKKGDTFTVDGLKYKAISGKAVEVVGSTSKKITKVNIPATIKYNGIKLSVEKISDKAFNGYTKLKTVSIGKNIKEIGKETFYKCSKLKTVKILSSQISTIGTNAFNKIYKKAKISVPASTYTNIKSLINKSGIGNKVKISKK